MTEQPSNDQPSPDIPSPDVPPVPLVPPVAPPPPPPPPPDPGFQAPPAPGYQAPPAAAYPAAGYPAPGYPQPGYPVPGYPAGYDPAAKSRLLAGLLGIFLGGFGVHRFYLGYTSIGVVQIIVTVLTCGLGSLWGLVEGIMILAGAASFRTDAEGRPLRD